MWASYALELHPQLRLNLKIRADFAVEAKFGEANDLFVTNVADVPEEAIHENGPPINWVTDFFVTSLGQPVWF